MALAAHARLKLLSYLLHLFAKGVFGSPCVLGMAFPTETGSSHTGWTEILVLVWWLVSVETS